MILCRYIIKVQAKTLFYLTSIIAALVFTVDFIETLRVETVQQHTIFTVAIKAALKFPYIVSSIYPYIFLGASGIVLWSLLKSNQITILKTIGYRDIDILKPMILFGIVIGTTWLLAVHPIACNLYFKIMNPELIAKIYDPDSKVEDIWIHQKIENEDILTHIDEVYKKTAKNISIYFINKNGTAYRKILALKASVSDNGFTLYDGVIFEQSEKTLKRFSTIFFDTKLSEKHFVSTLKQPEFMGIYDLIELLKLRSEVNLGYKNILSQINSLLMVILLTALMPLFAAIPCMVNSRHYTTVQAFSILISGSVFMYLVLGILRLLSSGQPISIAISIWLPVLILGGTSLCFITLRENNYAIFT